MSASGRVVIAGGSGLIGRALAARLVGNGAEVVVLTRRAGEAELAPGVSAVEWGGGDERWIPALEGAQAVVNLAGANLAKGRWTKRRKAELGSSRLEPTRALVAAIAQLDVRRRPRVLAQGSAVGYYGASDDRELDEASPPGSGFLPDLCVEWERASAPVEALGVRRLLLRTGIVLAREGGALKKMLPPFRLGIAGRLGSGRQWVSWIAIADQVGAIVHLLSDPSIEGPFDLTAPRPVRNAELTRALARAVRRPAIVPVPGIALRLLFGELAESLLTGQRVLPRRLLASGYRFESPELDGALAALLGQAG